MRQVLFEIPIFGWPVFGYGFMLLIAFLLCPIVAARIVSKYGDPDGKSTDPVIIHDLAFWFFLSGLVGARLFYVIQYWNQFQNPIVDFFALWRGGLVIYGGAFGALVGLLIFTHYHKANRLWLLDVLAAPMALGLAIGRIGCLLNGCCFGDYCEHAGGLRFPPGSPPHFRYVSTGYQTRLGFMVTPEERRVLLVEPGSAADQAGLTVGAEIVAVNERETPTPEAVQRALLSLSGEPGGLQGLSEKEMKFAGPFTLRVRDSGAERTLTLWAMRSLPLQPTQLFMSLDGFILFFFLWSYFPIHRRHGEVIAAWAMITAMTRFLIEYLRSDETALADGLTISQNVSFLIFAAGLATFIYVRWSNSSPRPPASSSRESMAATYSTPPTEVVEDG